MRLTEVQSTASALLTAVSAIAAFGAILLEDGITDLEDAILTRTDSTGCCIVLGDINSSDRDQGSDGRRAISNSILTVFVFESPSITHSPSGLSLADTIITAITGNENFQFSAMDRAANEKGGTLIAIDFNARVMLGA